MKRDFQFLTDLTSDFFARKSVRDTLCIISDFEISGWEKWIQIEFAKFCKDHEEISEWGRELRYELDRRMSNGKSSCSVDFLIRQKRKQSPLGIEIKQQSSPNGCVKAMLRDVAKVRRIKYSQDNLRGIWCIGIHSATSPAEVNRLIAYHADSMNIDIDPDLVFSKEIGRTGFSVTVL
ncbi:MAG: hypothetical protein M0R47_17400 [Methylobacter sp.]|jgi:hypothetical protein|uniref:hypothetical protein n=1 Tax=Methylobacter sp. TaxID=2051955 RepID=UPI0025E7EB4F|nr:hypothetical protein [Methylobacter sp.]MCK9622301.1 hypothetical protein [Methylobacter sp.]